MSRVGAGRAVVVAVVVAVAVVVGVVLRGTLKGGRRPPMFNPWRRSRPMELSPKDKQRFALIDRLTAAKLRYGDIPELEAKQFEGDIE